jgi:hypothetical protein
MCPLVTSVDPAPQPRPPPYKPAVRPPRRRGSEDEQYQGYGRWYVTLSSSPEAKKFAVVVQRTRTRISPVGLT